MRTINAKIYFNRINAEDLQAEIEYAKAYNLRHGMELNVTTEQVNVSGYASSEFREVRPGVNFCILLGSEVLFPIDGSQDVSIFVFDQDEWRTLPGSQYPLKTDTPTSDCVTVNGKPYINLGVYMPQREGAGIVLAHELMHAYGRMATAAGYAFEDCMDSMIVDGVAREYYLNDQPDNPNSNFINQWERLISCGYFKELESGVFPPQQQTADMKPTVTIKRNIDNGTETIGTLTYGSFSCSTLECPWKDNANDVSSIPPGTYEARIAPLGTFNNQPFYELQNVPNRTGIFIHPANYYSQLEGCIALGTGPSDINRDGQEDITSSVNTVAKFMKLTGGQPITLVIS